MSASIPSKDIHCSDTKDLLRKPFRFYLKQHPRVFAIGIVALFITNGLDILTPLALKAGIDAIEAKSQEGVYRAILMYVGLMAGVLIFRYTWRIFIGRFHHSVADDLRQRIFAKLTSLGPSFYQKKPVGELMSLLTNDVNSFRTAIGPGVLVLLDGIFYTAMIIPVMISLSWDWTWKTLILLPMVPFFVNKMENVIHVRFRNQQDRLAEVSANAQEIVSGIRVIKGFAQENNQSRTFDEISRRFEIACNKMSKADAVFMPSMEGMIAIGTVILLYFCSSDVTTGAMTLGTFVAFHEYIRRMVWPMASFGFSVSMIEQGRASFGRIGELLATETDIPDSGSARVERFEKLEIRDLNFTYAGAPTPALKNINLTIRAGETIGLVGPVGAGKTTLLQLLCRLYPAEKGMIRINDLDLSEIRRDCLSRSISLVPQDAFLFSDTIAENVAFGLPSFPGLEPVEEAASTVNIDREINEIPQKYSAYLGERGVNLSGGQKQRLTIARALIRSSSVVMLDDSLSAVDGRTEKAITIALQEARNRNPNQSVILVSHRLATLKHADRIVVLNRGEIEGIGSHDELIYSSPTYKLLHELQTKAPNTGEATAAFSTFAENGGVQ